MSTTTARRTGPTPAAVVVVLFLALALGVALGVAGLPTHRTTAAPVEHAAPAADELVGRQLVRVADGARCQVVTPAGDIDCEAPAQRTGAGTAVPSAEQLAGPGTDAIPGAPAVGGPAIEEDEPGWNCATMGNLQCGPDVTPGA